MSEARPASVFSYLNYRRFLAESVKFLREHRGLSVRKISKLCGFSSSSFLKRVTDGKKNILEKSARRIARALELKAEETEFFTHLVHYNQAQEPEQKDLAFRKLLSYRRFVQTHQLSADEYELCSKWYLPALLELLKTPLAFSNAKKMGQALQISEREASDGLALLQRLKLIEYKDGHYKQLHPLRQSEPEMQSLVIRQYHKQMIERANRALEEISLEQRSFAGLTVALAPSEFAHFKKRLFEFMQEVNSESGSVLDPQVVYQINFQLFPLSVTPEASDNSSEQKKKNH